MSEHPNIPAAVVLGLTGFTSHQNLKNARDDFGPEFARRYDGSARPFSLPEAAVMTLAARLMALGIRRPEATAIAARAMRPVMELLFDPSAPSAWMFARRAPADAEERWRVVVATAEQGAAADELFATVSAQICINLRHVVSEVIEAVEGRA
jgi:hypothetical protein